MFSSLRLGRVLGIDLYLHPSFWLLPLLVLTGGSADPTLELAVLFAVFGCVALHELGHAVAAGWYGIRTRDITLYPIGGVARLEGMPDRAVPEIVVALAGPAVNVGIAAALAFVLAAGLVPAAPGLLEAREATRFLSRVLEANVFLVLFNLIPAFPMDGGRVLRAFVHLFTDRVTATRAATTIGAGVAALMFLAGLATGNLMLSVIAFAVFILGRAELAHVELAADEDRRRAAYRRYGWADPAWGDDIPVVRPRVAVARPIDGWQFDPGRRVWVEYRGGVPVRTWPAAG